MSKWVSVPIERVPIAEYAGQSKDRIINLDQVAEIALSTQGNECYVRFADGTEDYITGAVAIPFYQECIRTIFGKEQE